MSRVKSRDVRLVGYEHPDARSLVDEVQQEYVRRYGSPDATPVDPGEFGPPSGVFFVAYLADVPVAMGGWRLHSDDAELSWAGRAAELKRMYVVPAHRGQGYARAVLDRLERAAIDAGVDWMVLETGLAQPEAIALYRACGYDEVAPFGHYANAPLAVHLGKPMTPASLG